MMQKRAVFEVLTAAALLVAAPCGAAIAADSPAVIAAATPAACPNRYVTTTINRFNPGSSPQIKTADFPLTFAHPGIKLKEGALQRNRQRPTLQPFPARRLTPPDSRNCPPPGRCR